MTRHAAAVRYARALFDVALREANVETVGAELSEFATLIGSHEALAHVFANPAIPAARKSAVVQAVLEHAGAMSPAVVEVDHVAGRPRSARPDPGSRHRLPGPPARSPEGRARVGDRGRSPRRPHVACARAGTGAGDRSKSTARITGGHDDHRRRHHPAGQHRVRRQRHDSADEDEGSVDSGRPALTS